MRTSSRGTECTCARFFAANGQALYGAEYDSEYDTATNRTVLVWRRQAPVGQATEVLRPGDPGYLTAGERGYLASMRRLLRMIRRSPRLERVLVMDDDVRFHCQLSSKLAALLEEPRCDGSGVLLLGVRATPAVPHATISRTPTARPLPLGASLAVGGHQRTAHGHFQGRESRNGMQQRQDGQRRERAALRGHPAQAERGECRIS